MELLLGIALLIIFIVLIKLGRVAIRIARLREAELEARLLDRRERR